jgi:GNAT superfamily N-acetyltransferase
VQVLSEPVRILYSMGNEDLSSERFCFLPRINLFLMIVPSTKQDFIRIYEIINDAASAYKGIIPEDRWHEPYMSETELQDQIDDGVAFWYYVENDIVIGVMGYQEKGDVTLIRHAYVRTAARNKGTGGKLLRHLSKLTTNPILIGTWADATWAIEFYKKHGFRLVSFEEKEELLRKYWSIPLRQIETSVFLSNQA